MADFPEDVQDELDSITAGAAENAILLRIKHLARDADVDEIAKLAGAFSDVMGMELTIERPEVPDGD